MIITEILRDTHENETVMVDYMVDKIKTKSQVKVHFFESIDASFINLSNMVKNEALNIVKDRKIKQSEDIDKIMVVDGSNLLYLNMMLLFIVNLLIPFSTVNVEHSYSVMNLLFSFLWSPLTKPVWID